MLTVSSTRYEHVDPRQVLQKQYEMIIEPIKDCFGENHYKIISPEDALFVSKNLAIQFYTMTLQPEGRAKRLMQNIAPKEYTPEDLDAPPIMTPALYLKSAGELFDCTSYRCTKEGRSMGNIYDEPLSVLIERKTKEPIHRMERDLGVRGIYNFLYTNKNIKINATSHCDLCQQVFSNKENIDKINSYLVEPWAKHESLLRAKAEIKNNYIRKSGKFIYTALSHLSSLFHRL